MTGCVGRPAFRRKDLVHGGGVLRVRAQPVYGLGRKRDQLAVAQSLHGGVDLNLTGAYVSYHGRGFYLAALSQERAPALCLRQRPQTRSCRPVAKMFRYFGVPETPIQYTDP